MYTLLILGLSKGKILPMTLPSEYKMVKGTVVQIEKTLINDRLRVLKVSRKSHIPTIYNFAVIYPCNFIFS